MAGKSKNVIPAKGPVPHLVLEEQCIDNAEEEAVVVSESG